MARRFAVRGCDVALHYNGSVGPATALRDELHSLGVASEVFQADLRDAGAVERLFDEVENWCGQIDFLINNASQFINDDIVDQHQEAAVSHMAVNATAPTILSKRLAAQPADGRDRLILNMLDNKLSALNPDFYSYTLSKSVLSTATEMLSMRFGGNPRVCGIAPSITLISGKQNQENFEKSSRINPLNRRVSPDDLCDAAEFLWDTKSLNGQVLTIDGGQSLLRLPRDVAFLVKDGAIDGAV